MKLRMLFFLLPLSSLIFSAEGSTQSGGVADLKWSAINFLFFLALLLGKIRRPLREKFEKNAKDVAFLFEFSAKKDREAQIRLDIYKGKMDTINLEYQRITGHVEREIKEAIENAQKRTKAQTEQMKNNFENKIFQEERVLSAKITNQFMDKVLEEAKDTIKQNQELKKRVTSKLVLEHLCSPRGLL